jgi:hypothetical protein
LFALLLALAVIWADRAADRASMGLAVAAGCAAALTLLTRTIGIAAGVAVVAFLGWKYLRAAGAASRNRTPAHILGAALPIGLAAVAWFAWTLTHQDGIDPALGINYGSYGEVLRQTGLGALGSSALDLPRPLVAITLGWLYPPALAVALALPAGAIGLYGLWTLARRSSAGLTLAGYLAILVVWPFPPDRFLWAVLPWLALAWTAGAVALCRYAVARVPVLILALTAVGGFGFYQVRGVSARGWATQAQAISANFAELLPALRELPADAVLATDNESLVWLYTGRRAVPLFIYGYRGATVTYPTTADHRAYLERQGVTHVVLASASSPSAQQLRALIGAFPGWLEPVHGWPGGRWIFAVRR